MEKLNEKQQYIFDNSIPFTDLRCDICKWKYSYLSKDFVDWWEFVADRCLLHYKCKTCNIWFNIYSDWEKEK